MAFTVPLVHVPRLETVLWTNRAQELMVNLNSEYPCSQTSRSRLTATRNWRPTTRSVKSRARVTMGHVGSLAQATFPPPCMSRTWLALRGEPLSHWVATDDSWSKWRPWACPVLRDVQSPPQPLILFTDGSTGAGWGEPSGCSVVVTLQGLVVNSFSFPCGASGNHHLWAARHLYVQTECEPRTNATWWSCISASSSSSPLLLHLLSLYVPSVLQRLGQPLR